MAFLFGRNRQKSSSDLPRLVKELLPRLDGPDGTTKAEELAKLLSQMKLILQGTHENESSPEQAFQLVTAIIQEDLLLQLVRSIHRLPFESRKDTQVIFSSVFRFKVSPTATEPPCLNHVIDHRPEVIIALCRGYDQRESAMPCGTVLREILKHDAITAIILYDEPEMPPVINTSGGAAPSQRPQQGKTLPTINPDIAQTGNGVFWRFFDWIDRGAFEVSADAFTTFRDILTKHKALIAQYLSMNFDLFFTRYNATLVQSHSYVTKRQSIKLLGEILLDRANYQVMTAYVDRGDHLKLCMNLLRDERRMVQYEGFHVFKVFVANPHKSLAVQRILINNRDRLTAFLANFLVDRNDEDEQFVDEKAFLIKQILALPAQPLEAIAAGGGAASSLESGPGPGPGPGPGNS